MNWDCILKFKAYNQESERKAAVVLGRNLEKTSYQMMLTGAGW